MTKKLMKFLIFTYFPFKQPTKSGPNCTFAQCARVYGVCANATVVFGLVNIRVYCFSLPATTIYIYIFYFISFLVSIFFF